MKISIEITRSPVRLENLSWHPHLGGVRAEVRGFSIIRNPYSYGGDKGLFEVMDPNHEVHGFLTKKQVEDLING